MIRYQWSNISTKIKYKQYIEQNIQHQLPWFANIEKTKTKQKK